MPAPGAPEPPFTALSQTLPEFQATSTASGLLPAKALRAPLRRPVARMVLMPSVSAHASPGSPPLTLFRTKSVAAAPVRAQVAPPLGAVLKVTLFAPLQRVPRAFSTGDHVPLHPLALTESVSSRLIPSMPASATCSALTSA